MFWLGLLGLLLAPVNLVSLLLKPELLRVYCIPIRQLC
jgi:hypothetical protein